MTSALCILIFSFLNRFAGGGLLWQKLGGQHGGILEGRAIWYATPVALLALVPLLGTMNAALCAASFLLWRTPGWYNSIDAGTNTENPLRDFAVMAGRGLLLFPVFLYAAWEMQSLIPAAGLVVTSLAIATAYHIAWHWKPVRGLNADGVARAEYLAGGVLGAAFSALHFWKVAVQ